MHPRIVALSPRKLIGMKVKMSLADNKTSLLWQSFMPRRKEIKNKVNNDLISMQVYHDAQRPADINQQFDKWAAVEVESLNEVPLDMDTFVLEGGLYAVFDYKGLSTDNSIFRYIFSEWLPASEYTLDFRPHFEVLGEKYKNNDPESEEEIWISIKLKSN